MAGSAAFFSPPSLLCSSLCVMAVNVWAGSGFGVEEYGSDTVVGRRQHAGCGDRLYSLLLGLHSELHSKGRVVGGKTKVRQMRCIENATSRLVIFSKRLNGMLKKAFELLVLCEAVVALVILSPRGMIYEFFKRKTKSSICTIIKLLSG